MSNTTTTQENERPSKRKGSKRYALVVLCLNSIPFIGSLYLMFFGGTRGFWAPSEQQMGIVGSIFFGVMILLTVLALKINVKYRIASIVLTTLAAITPVLVFVSFLLIANN